eukprot:COSAG01_NODE_5201_length_4414_cov_468.710313_7_plen_141_part_00
MAATLITMAGNSSSTTAASRRLAIAAQHMNPQEAAAVALTTAASSSKNTCNNSISSTAAASGNEWSEVDDIFSAYFADGDTAPGCAYGVVVDGVLVHTGGLGTLRAGEEEAVVPPRADCLFRIASMTKSFVAAVPSQRQT